MKQKVQRRASFLLSILLIASLFIIPAEAASVPSVSTSKYIKAYCVARSGEITVYSNASLTSRNSYEYIDAATDECWIVGYNTNYNSLTVSYPTSSGRKTRYVPASVFFSKKVSDSASTVKVTKLVTSYKWANGSETYGYADPGDVCYLLGTSGSRTRFLYPISGGYKLAWANTSEINSATGTKTSTTTNTSSVSWQYPMSNAYCTWTTPGSNMSWGQYTYRGGNSRTYHLGCDIYGSSSTVYAAASGVVAACSSSNSGANGKYIIIRHTMSGKTVYSFYAHLSSLKVSTGQSVSKGTAIAVAGGSGYGENYYYGTHLHFAIMDTLWSGGDYYGYATPFSGNKVTYGGVTYYNPVYVVKNQKLP